MIYLLRLMACLCVFLSASILAIDTDNDSLNDSVETNTGVFVSIENTGTNPTLADTDGDGVNDGLEIGFGSDPQDPTISPFGEQQKLSASDGQAGNLFGASVAIAGNTALVGAYGAGNIGAVYVFTQSNGVWSEQAKLTASDGQANDQFGYSVAIEGDTVVIGAYAEDDGGVDAGAAYVFIRSNGTWSEQAKLTASDAQAGDFFGDSVAIAGNTVVIGAYGYNGDPNYYYADNIGAAYVFTRSNGTWSEQARLTSSDPQYDERIGGSVAIAGDTAIIGNGSYRARVYVFNRINGVWSEQQELIRAVPFPTDLFGGSVAIAGDTAVVGALENDNVGAAYVFTRSNGVWGEQAKLTASNITGFDRFGGSVAIRENTVVIGAHAETINGKGAGAAHIFTRDSGVWSEMMTLTAYDAQNDDAFGHSVAIIKDDEVVIGAYFEDSEGSDAGAAYFINFIPSSFADTDSDTIFDLVDNCANAPNQTQTDLDDDGIGDICDTNKDGDDWPDAVELAIGSDPNNPDDADIATNYFVTQINNYNVLANPTLDTDSDGVSDALEVIMNGDPNDDEDSGLIDELASYIAFQAGKAVPALGGLGLVILSSGLFLITILFGRKRKK